MRGEPQHHVHSVPVLGRPRSRDQARTQLGEFARADEWAAERDRIRDEILKRGWSEKRQAYAQAFDSDELDASLLLMPSWGSCRRPTSGCARRSTRSRAT